MLIKFQHDVDLAGLGLSIETRRTLGSYTNSFSISDSISVIVGELIPTRQGDELDADFKKRCNDYWSTFCQNLGYQEAMSYSGRGHALIREELANETIFKNCFSQRGADNTDVQFTNRFSPARSSTVARQRTYDNVPYASLLYFACSGIAASDIARRIVNKYASKGFKIPRFLKEMLLVNRKSTCGNVIITPSTKLLDENLLNFSELDKTIFDFEWLLTEDGLSQAFSLFQRLSHFEDNYVEMVEFDSAIPLESGFQTTMMGFSTLFTPKEQIDIPYYSTKGEERKSQTHKQSLSSGSSLVLHPEHTYPGNAPNGVHALDAHIQQRILHTKTGDVINLDDVSPELPIVGDSRSKTLYILQRMTQLKNEVNQKRSVKSQSQQTDSKPAVQQQKVHKRTEQKGNDQKPQADSLIKTIKSVLACKIPKSIQLTILRSLISFGSGLTNRNSNNKLVLQV